jgi:bifunctional non-homologous end joining protein LigD
VEAFSSFAEGPFCYNFIPMAKKKNVLEIDGRSLEVSNLEKVMYPQTGFTKGEVIDYYIRISHVLLPHLKDRPLTMKRYPDGIHGMHFYEKDAPKHTPEWVKLFKVPRKVEKKGEKDIDFILVNDLPALVWTANLANLEMHVFLSKVPDYQQPTAVVFDLDPGPPADVMSCAQVALWLKEILDHFKLKSFAKSSGSKGIQLYVPLNTKTDYDSTSAFAKAIAIALEDQHPDRVISRMAKAERKGKVFIDWSQNSDFKTTVCVYSLRAKQDVPYVSVPMEWKEIEAALDNKDNSAFYLEPEAALKKVEEKGDLFEPVLTLKQKLPDTGAAELLEVASKTTAHASKPKPAAKPKKRGVAKGDTSIEAYNKKRDFSQTKEPPGKTKTAAGKAPLFVIQKHQASRLHYDFRLEMQGVLRSWAVPKGPPTERMERRLAMHVEDHPMDYARFEGTIPEGNYGAGTVMVWDIGTYTVAEGNPAQAYYSGKIPLILNGKKLKGEWTLVRAWKKEDQGGKQSWLLLKTGDGVPPISAKKDDQSALTGRTMKQIAKDNDAQWISNRRRKTTETRRHRA